MSPLRRRRRSSRADGYLDRFHDMSGVPLPPDAESHLRADHPRLHELREAYARVDLPVTEGSRWTESSVKGFLDLRYFRGETLITWHYRESPEVDRLRYYTYLREVESRDPAGWVGVLGEDGAFGCWTFPFEGRGLVSRDLLESVGELSFLDRELALRGRAGLRVLDIGAGYGRLAHRMCAALDVADYCCVDAIAESTFVCEYYVRHRGLSPRARVLALPDVESVLTTPGSFDVALNVHSFSECTFEAIEWWVALLDRLEVPHLFLVPNDGDQLLSLERDGTRRDFGPLLAARGYERTASEPAIADPAARELLALHDRLHLYARRA